jgi:hypothetical protein
LCFMAADHIKGDAGVIPCRSYFFFSPAFCLAQRAF